MSHRRHGRGVLLPGSIACLLYMLGAGGLVSACGDDTILLPADGGRFDATAADITTEGVANEAAQDAGCSAFDASDLEEAQVEAGKALVLALECAKCHGDLFSGNPDGVSSPETEGGLAYPPNLTPDPTTGLGCWTDEQIENAFLNGIDNKGDPLCPPMPHFAEEGVDASGAADIVAYLRGLPAVVMNTPNTPNCTLEPTDAGGGGPDDATAEEAGGASAHDAGDAGAQEAADAGAHNAGDASPPDAGELDASDAGVDADAGEQDAAGE